MNFKLYIFDSSSFITPYRNYYAMDIVPSFWGKLENLIKDGKIGTIDKVKNEIEKGDDDLKKWFKEHFQKAVSFQRKNNTDNLFKFGQNNKEMENYRKIIQWVDKADFKPTAKNDFKDHKKADAYLIAFCKTYELPLVTEESYNKNQKKKVPIPVVCEEFKVKWMNIHDFMREVGIKI